ncbi:hypothetical protein CYMTET_52163 [Cymbomonas tetramitiformis]|uniref:Reverse transcriptase domain-containing protein n=1 Tax=Cymbomonas tetramitiformis TaxID=36881 RepID=A0AAE0BJP0_9CHLO|nr:hypothetical protein CYMTET_52163 [Cymbomonas tetramitiformis]
MKLLEPAVQAESKRLLEQFYGTPTPWEGGRVREFWDDREGDVIPNYRWGEQRLYRDRHNIARLCHILLRPDQDMPSRPSDEHVCVEFARCREQKWVTRDQLQFPSWLAIDQKLRWYEGKGEWSIGDSYSAHIPSSAGKQNVILPRARSESMLDASMIKKLQDKVQALLTYPNGEVTGTLMWDMEKRAFCVQPNTATQYLDLMHCTLDHAAVFNGEELLQELQLPHWYERIGVWAYQLLRVFASNATAQEYLRLGDSRRMIKTVNSEQEGYAAIRAGAARRPPPPHSTQVTKRATARPSATVAEAGPSRAAAGPSRTRSLSHERLARSNSTPRRGYSPTPSPVSSDNGLGPAWFPSTFPGRRAFHTCESSSDAAAVPVSGEGAPIPVGVGLECRTERHEHSVFHPVWWRRWGRPMPTWWIMGREHPRAKPVYYIFEDHTRCLRCHTRFTEEYLMRDDRKFTQMLWGSREVAAPWVLKAPESLEARLYPAAAPPALQARVAVRPEHVDEVRDRPARQQRRPPGSVVGRELRASAGARVSAPSVAVVRLPLVSPPRREHPGHRPASPHGARLLRIRYAVLRRRHLRTTRNDDERVFIRASRAQREGGPAERPTLWPWAAGTGSPHEAGCPAGVYLACRQCSGLVVAGTGSHAHGRHLGNVGSSGVAPVVVPFSGLVVALRGLARGLAADMVGVVISLAYWSRCATAILLVILAWLWVCAGVYAEDMTHRTSYAVDIPLDMHDGRGWISLALRRAGRSFGAIFSYIASRKPPTWRLFLRWWSLLLLDEVLPYTVLDELQPLGDTTVTKDEAAWLDTELNATFGGHPDFKKEHWREEMRAVLRRCKNTFANSPHDLTGYKGKAEHNTFSIPFIDESKAAYQRPRKYSPGEQEIIDIHCKELLEYGFIEPAAKHCRHASNVVVAGKKDHETGLWTQTRFCVDLRGVNRHSLKDNTLPHRPEELYQKVAKAKFKTTLDATKAFHQIPMATEEDRSKTAFWWKNQLYQYTSMPFGAAGATSAFVRIMDYELRHLQHCTVAYVDGYCPAVLVGRTQIAFGPPTRTGFAGIF